jgi:hypothetical protein
VSLSSIILRNKNSNSAFDVKGIKMREQKEIVLEEKIELELNEKIIKSNKKKVKTKEYFNEELDKKIIENYENKDIMMLSSEYNVRPWEIVSLLVRYKIIQKRDEAIGYDKYKETDEYKQKIKN